jgi:protein-S-isoprenylcysteine O-methyltransferase Ste14
VRGDAHAGHARERLVIRREEGYMDRAFGEEYDRFRREVRLWL